MLNRMGHDELDPKSAISHLTNFDGYLPAAVVFRPGAIRARMAERRLAAVISESDLEEISFELDRLMETERVGRVEGGTRGNKCHAITSKRLVLELTHV